MALILELQPRLQKIEARVKSGNILQNAKVIIFSGVRYERMPDTAGIVLKSAKKSLKTA